jgi:hypothetical protein
MNSGSISDNSATNGGGVYLTSGSIYSLSGSISNNFPNNQAGGP